MGKNNSKNIITDYEDSDLKNEIIEYLSYVPDEFVQATQDEEEQNADEDN